jgi:DNA polymerase/3'-5' exonuclease PolX
MKPALRALEALSEDLSVLIDQDRLTEVRAIGPSLATTITELARTGPLPSG